MRKLKVLFFGMADCEFTNECVDHLVDLNFNVETILTKTRGEPFPSEALSWKGDLIFSYKCYWLIPSRVLSRAKLAAINLHPSLPEYRGSGGYCWALYEGKSLYGVTVHHMSPKLDDGKIISVPTFPIEDTDDLDTLTKKTSIFSASLVKKLFSDLAVLDEQGIISKLHTETANEIWKGPVRKISEVNAMKFIDESLSSDEKDRRIRAFHSKAYPMITKIGTKIFKLGESLEL